MKGHDTRLGLVFSGRSILLWQHFDYVRSVPEHHFVVLSFGKQSKQRSPYQGPCCCRIVVVLSCTIIDCNHNQAAL